MKSSKKVLLFGGSYNPIHQGHVNAAIYASNFLSVDEVWLMPRKYNYDGSLLLDGKHRVNMINMAIDHLSNFKVCDIELKDKNKELIYTYNTAKKLTKKYKDIKFYFLIGADQVNNLKRWYRIDELTKLFNFVCFKRPGYILNEDICNEFNIIIIDGALVDMSSTLVRSGVFEKIDGDIKQYINEKQLYLKERVMPCLKESRFIHVLSTARLAKKIAKAIGENPNRAYVAGILHDISKGLTHDEIDYIVKKFYPNKLSLPKFAYHAYASEYIAINQFGIKDKAILKAIRNHVIANKQMSKLDKIIYCADKLEETRTFSHLVNDIREMAFIDIDKCFIMTMENQIEAFKNETKEVNPTIHTMVKYYKEKEYGR